MWRFDEVPRFQGSKVPSKGSKHAVPRFQAKGYFKRDLAEFRVNPDQFGYPVVLPTILHSCWGLTRAYFLGKSSIPKSKNSVCKPGNPKCDNR